MTHPPINFAKLPPIDMERFERAMSLRAVPMSANDTEGPRGCYRVLKVADPLSEPHYVDLLSSDVPRCDCGDFVYRESLCKHILACLIHENHPVARQAMADFIMGKRK